MMDIVNNVIFFNHDIFANPPRLQHVQVFILLYTAREYFQQQRA